MNKKRLLKIQVPFIAQPFQILGHFFHTAFLDGIIFLKNPVGKTVFFFYVIFYFSKYLYCKNQQQANSLTYHIHKRKPYNTLFLNQQKSGHQHENEVA